MSLRRLPRDICISVALELELNEILRLSASCRAMHDASMCAADKALAAELDGFDGKCLPAGHRMKNNETPHRRLLWAALRPHVVVCGYRQAWPEMTIPFRLSLDTDGPLVLRFHIIVAKAPRGTPKIGFVDAEAAPPFGVWKGDLSRGRAGPGPWAIACCPASGTLIATNEAFQSQSILSETSTVRCAGLNKNYYVGKLKWDTLGDPTRKWNAPIYTAFALEHGKLTCYRIQNNRWHSSGVLFGNLPRRVTPCIFLSSCIGYVKVSFESMSNRTPEILCAGCDELGHGLEKGWVRCASLDETH